MKLGEIKHLFVRKTRTTLGRQLRVLLIGGIVPFAVIALAALLMLGSLNREYEVTLQNATTASEFNFDFKDNMDLNMYLYVVQSRDMPNLPLEEVYQAQRVLQRLKKTTTQEENCWRIESMLDLTERMESCMIEIKKTSSYDTRMDMLEKDIYTITGLIEQYMHEYLYDEVYALRDLQQQINRRVWISIILMAAIGLFTMTITLVSATHISRGITQPVQALCGKAEQLGAGDFTVRPLETQYIEIKTLDDGFNEMTSQINQLLEREKENQTALRRAEFELLQAQINPHFLYNTFDSIIWLAEMQKNKQVVQMTTALSKFFRYSLSNGADVISLGTEKQQVESYLEIQQVRYRDILDYEIDIPDTLLSYPIPKLTLQPLVENALYHGIKNKRGGGIIAIVAYDYDTWIEIVVTDNGGGMSQEQLKQLRAGVYEGRSGSFGLKNVHQRLRLYCGEQAGLIFESEEGEGTTVTVCLPKQNQLST